MTLMPMRALLDSFCSIPELCGSPIWASGDGPSVRTVQNWVTRLGLPRHKRGRLVWFQENEVYSFLIQECLVCPRESRAVIFEAIKKANPPQLVSFYKLPQLPIWTASSVPSERTLRKWISEGTIAYFRIGHTLYFQERAVRLSLGYQEASALVQAA